MDAKSTYPSLAPMLFNTANGTTTSEKQVTVEVPRLGDKVHPYVMENTPAVLSLGRSTMRRGGVRIPLALVRNPLLHRTQWETPLARGGWVHPLPPYECPVIASECE